MIKIKLQRLSWTYDPNSPLGPEGGFGAVFFGESEDGKNVAVKKLHIKPTELANREIRIGEKLLDQEYKYILPIYDVGKDPESDSYFLVMPIAEKSLRYHIENLGALPQEEAIRILLEIAYGLKEVQDIVHRDLKPGNILFHEGRWKIADFGIARFVEESTSSKTLKDFLSWAYAAPEQWRFERASNATDIYALGCISYELISGHPPFQGPQGEDFREQHLHGKPLGLPTGIDSPLKSLIFMMIRKVPDSRPNIERVINLLERINKGGSQRFQGGGFAALAQAGVAAAEESVKKEAKQNKEENEQKERERLANEAHNILSGIVETLAAKITEFAPSAEVIGEWDHFLRIQLGYALLEISLLFGKNPIPKGVAKRSGWDLVMGATVQVFQRQPKEYTWGANLWYTNLGEAKEYRWWEISYMKNASVQGERPYEPFAVNQVEDADKAAGPGIGIILHATRPQPIDDEYEEGFCDRWAKILADAYQGKLNRPRSLPLS